MATQLASQASVFAVLSGYAESLPAWQKSGIEHVEVHTYRSAFGAMWAWIDRRRIRRVAQKIQDLKPDILLFPMFYTLNPLLQKYLASIPSLVAVHDPTPHPGLVGRVYQVLEDSSIRQASQCLVFSQAFVGTMQKRGVPSGRIVVIHHGELSYLKPSAQVGVSDSPLHKSHHTLLFFGRITGYKGLDVLLAAYRIACRDLPLRLLIVGSGDLRPYRSLIKGLDGIEIVNRWIAESDIWQYFSRADLVVLPYTSATQSGIIPVAASYALPVIATRIGGLPEQIEDGQTGLLVEPASVEQLVQAIRKLVTQPSLAKSLGINLQHRYKGEFSWEKTASQILSVCEKVIS